MSDEFTFKLDYPLTQEQIDVITDAELEHTSKIWFTTRSGKEVEFVKTPQWIPCEERLPEVGEDVFISVGGRVCEAHLRESGEYFLTHKTKALVTEWDADAWMPLPKAYEGRTE